MSVSGYSSTEAAVAKRRRFSLYEGMKDALPIAMAYVAYGSIFGLIASESGLTTIETSLMSALVFSGAAQFAAIGLLAGKASPLMWFATSVFLGLRHLIMGMSISPHLSTLNRWQKALLAFGLTDEAYALSISRFTRIGSDHVYMSGVIVILYVAWVLSAVVGISIGKSIHSVAQYGLDFAFPSCFIGLVVMSLKQKEDWVVALAAIVMTLLCVKILPENTFLLAVGLIPPALGYFLQNNREKRS